MGSLGELTNKNCYCKLLHLLIHSHKLSPYPRETWLRGKIGSLEEWLAATVTFKRTHLLIHYLKNPLTRERLLGVQFKPSYPAKTKRGEATSLPCGTSFPAISYDLSKVRLNIGKGGYSLMLSLITRVTYLSWDRSSLMKQIDTSIALELSINLISFPEYRVVSLNILLLEFHNLYPRCLSVGSSDLLMPTTLGQLAVNLGWWRGQQHLRRFRLRK